MCGDNFFVKLNEFFNIWEDMYIIAHPLAMNDPSSFNFTSSHEKRGYVPTESNLGLKRDMLISENVLL